MPRLPTTRQRPDGLTYRPAFLGRDEQAAVLTTLDGVEFGAVRMRGQTARRTVAHFGCTYDYQGRGLVPAEPLPGELAWLRARSATLAGLSAGDLVQVLVTRYPSGAGIGWHRDAPVFGAQVVGVSLGAACRLRFQRRSNDARLVYDLDLEPGSVYLLEGPARWSWQHSIPPVAAPRSSITFRTLSDRAR